MRTPVTVRSVTPADLDPLADLVQQARDESARGPQVCSPDREVLARQLGALAAVPGGIVLVCVDDDDVPVGLLLGRVVEPNVFVDATDLHVEAVYVAPTHRRRGVGRALLTELGAVAADHDAQYVFAAATPGSRGLQRFLVQLGFAAAAGHRFTTPAALQRRLAGETPHRRTRPLDELIARRRRSREPVADLAP